MIKIEYALVLALVVLILTSCGTANSSQNTESPIIHSNEPVTSLPQTLERSECEPNCDLGDGSLTIEVSTIEDRFDYIEEVTKESVIRVHASFPSSNPDGTFEFVIKFDSGGYQNELISRGKLSGVNTIGGVEQYFYLPPFGQITGDATIEVFIPGWGLSTKTILVK